MKTNNSTPKTINTVAGYTCLGSLLDNLFKLAEPQIKQLGKRDTEALADLMRGASSHLSDIQTSMGAVMAAMPKDDLELQGVEIYHGLTQTLLLGESQDILSRLADDLADLAFTADQRA
ncbi:hypothetical protein LVJ83_11870 [Uruburuella testudinis]|uniref:Uncharacterized protein n=1 Tax=Uruburuella testudinis TaxID=1282863 RepID=A0ABY4DRD8_9NEIS|nr:hypothetical protein [Uruburuella testudinis]UOO81605.1 hypothetical protein LVJ83_11870 [Uruburuella testudinis]